MNKTLEMKLLTKILRVIAKRLKKIIKLDCCGECGCVLTEDNCNFEVSMEADNVEPIYFCLKCQEIVRENFW